MSNFIKSIDTSVTKSVIKNLPAIPVVSSKKEGSKIIFDAYPNYVALTHVYGSRFYETQIQGYILEIIKKTSPIHMNEFKRIVPYFWNRQKYTNIVDEYCRPILKSLAYKNEIIIKDDYIIYKNSEIKFRETKGESSRRDFTNIHPDELKEGILRILNVTKKMHVDELHTMIVKLCGFQSSSARIKEYMFHIIESLKKTKKIKVFDDSNVELIS